MDIVDIFDVSYEGAGVGKLDGQIVFVPKTLPGERVEVEIEKRTSKFLTAVAKNIIVPSPQRIKPACPHFDVCGGCDFQHCKEEYERALKRQILQKELKKVGFDGDVQFHPSNNRLHYRNKIKFEVCGDKLGYFKAKSHNFFEVDQCPIADEKISAAFLKIKEFVAENHFESLKNVYIKIVDETTYVCFLFEKNAPKMQKNVKFCVILWCFLLLEMFWKTTKQKLFALLERQKMTSGRFLR